MIHVYFLLVAFSLAQHDHSQHPSIQKIKATTEMATSYTYDEMVAQLRDINQNMNKLQIKYDRDTENLAPEMISESYSSIWESNFQPMYQDYADGYLILKNICKEIFFKGGCEVGEIWHDKYDGRGAAFREEFSQEVIKTAKDEYIRIKRQLGHKLDF